MTARLVHVRNMFAPHEGKREFEVAAGLPVCEAVDLTRWRLPPSTVLVRNDVMVKRAEWDALPLADGETAYLITMPQGGGSLKGFLQIFIQIIAIVVSIVVPYVGWLLGLAISIGGKLLLNSLFKPHVPKAVPNQGPTFALSAQRNLARLGGMIPEVFGRFAVTPDLAASPYTFYSSQDQLALRELFCIGVGDYEIHKMSIGSNVFWEDGAPTGTYPEIQVEIIPPGGSVTLFPDNVVTSTDVVGIEMLGTNQEGYGWLGPFVTNPAATQTNRIDIDVVMPGGAFSVDNDGNLVSTNIYFTVQSRPVDDDGNPTGGGSYTTLIEEHIQLSHRDAVRRTYAFSVAPGRYQVRVQRTDERQTDNKTSDQIYWSGMRAYLPSVATYGDVTLVAVYARATKNLNGDNAQQFNVEVTRKLPLYDRVNKTWSAPTATRSIAAAASYMLRSSNGAGLVDSRIDLDTLWALDETWTARGDYFDGAFTDKQSLWDALQLLLQVGRTKRYIAGSLVSFTRDEPKSVPTAGFSPRNMLAGSFSVDYALHDTNSVDALVVQYIDSRTWSVAEVFCALPDSTVSISDAPRLLIIGITDRAHAFREGMYMVAANRYRRIFPNWRTELEGRVCLPGSLIRVSHWRANWGASADAIMLEKNDGGDILTLSEPYKADSGTPLLTLQAPDGRLWGPVPVLLIDDGSEDGKARVQLLDTADAGGKYAGVPPRDWPVWADTGSQKEKPRAMIGHGAEVPQDAIVVSMKPDGGMTATVTAVIEDDRVHTADGTPLPEETNPPSAALVENLTIIGVILKEVTTVSGVQYITRINGAVAGAPDAVTFELRLRWTEDGDYSDPITSLGRTFSIPSAPGSVDAQVRAKGHSGFGDWFTADVLATTGESTFVPPDLPPEDIDTGDGGGSGSGYVSGQPYTVSWAAVPNAYKYHIDVMAKVNSGDPYSNVRSLSTFNTTFTYSPTMATADGGPFNDVYLVITPVNFGGTGGGGTPTY